MIVSILLQYTLVGMCSDTDNVVMRSVYFIATITIIVIGWSKINNKGMSMDKVLEVLINPFVVAIFETIQAPDSNSLYYRATLEWCYEHGLSCIMNLFSGIK